MCVFFQGAYTLLNILQPSQCNILTFAFLPFLYSSSLHIHSIRSISMGHYKRWSFKMWLSFLFPLSPRSIARTQGGSHCSHHQAVSPLWINEGLKISILIIIINNNIIIIIVIVIPYLRADEDIRNSNPTSKERGINKSTDNSTSKPSHVRKK